MPVVEIPGVNMTIRAFILRSPEVDDEGVAPVAAVLVDAVFAAEKLLDRLPSLQRRQFSRLLQASESIYLRRERGYILALMHRHVDALFFPRRLVARIHAQSHPHVLHPFFSLLPGKSLLQDDVAILQKELDLLGCSVGETSL